MLKKLPLLTAWLFSLVISHAQVTGDYRSNVVTGNWSDPLSWLTYNGATWVAAGTAPAATNNVYLQTGHTITVDVAGACNDLNISNNTTGTRLALGANTLSVNGKLGCVSSAVNTFPVTYTATIGGTAAWITSTTGKIQVVGTTRNLTTAGQWGAGNAGTTSPNGFDLEIALASGTVTCLTSIKARNVTITSGILQMGNASAMDILVDQGTQGLGSLTISSGATLNMSGGGNIQRITTAGATSHFGTLDVQSGGFLTYSSTTVGAIGAGTIALNGTLSYTAAGAQTMASRGSNSGGVQPATVNDLVVSGSGIKTMGINTTVTGLLSIATGCTLATSTTATTLSVSGTYSNSGTLTATAAGSSVVLNGSSPQSINLGTHSILQLNTNNAGGVALTTTNLNITGTAANCLLLTAGILDISGISATINGGISVVAGSITGSCTTDFTVTGGTATAVTIPLITNGLRNLNLTKTVATTITSGAALTLCGNLTVNASNTYALVATTVTVNGNVVNNGAVTATTGEILLSGGATAHALTGGTASWSNIELNDAQGATFTGTGTSTVTTLNVAAGDLTLNSFTTSLTVTTTTVTGTLNFGSGTTGARALGNLTVNNGGIVNVTVAPTGLLSTVDFTLASGSNWNNSINKDVTISGNVVSNSSTKTEGTGTYTLSGATKTITGSQPLNFTGLSMSGTYTSTLNVGVAGTFTVGGTYTNSTGATLNVTSAAAIAGAGTIANSTSTSVFNLTSASITPTLTATAAGNTVHYNSSTQLQTVKATTYRKLIITKPGFVAQMGGAITVQESIDIQAGTLYDNGNQITGTAATTLNMEPGTVLQLGNATATAFPTLLTNANMTLDAGSTVNYSSTAAQNVSNVPTYKVLTLTGNSVKSVVTGSITIQEDLNVNAGTFADAGFQINGTAGGTLTVAVGATLRLGAAASTTFPSSFGTINLNPVVTTTAANTSTVVYNSNVAQTIYSTTYGNLTLTTAAASAIVKTLTGGNATVTGIFTINTLNTFADGSNTLFANSTVTNNSVTGHTGAGKIELTGGSVAHSVNGTGPFTNLELDDAFGANMGANFTVSGTLSLTNGALDVNTRTLTLNGPAINQASGSLTTSTSSVLSFGPNTNANTGLYIPSSVANLSNLTLNIASTNKLSLNSSITLNAAGAGLTLTSGRVFLGNNDLTLLSTTTISGGSVNSYVIADSYAGYTGELRKTIPTSGFAAFTFHIGEESNTVADYSPMAITFNSNSTVRVIGVKVYDDTHPDNNTGGATAHWASRYWEVSDNQAGVGSYSYTSMSLTYSTAAPTDVNGTAGSFRLNQWDGTAWAELTSTHTAPSVTTSATYTETSGRLGGRVFAIRENAPRVYTWVYTNGSNSWAAPGSWSPARNTAHVKDILQFTNGGTPIATSVPSQNIGRLYVDNTDASLQCSGTVSLTLGAIATTQVLEVSNTAKLRIAGTGTNVLTLAFAASLANLSTDISGEVLVEANTPLTNALVFTNLTAANNTIAGSVINNGGVVTATTGTTTFGTGSFYKHNRNTGTVPTANWNANSTTEINSPATAPTAGINQVFGNFTLNTGAITTTLNGTTTVAGLLTLTNGILAIAANTLNVNGTCSTTAGRLSGTASSTLAIGGTGTGNMGNLSFVTGGQTVSVFTMNRAGTTPELSLGSPLTTATLNMTSGNVNNGANVITVSGTTTGSVTNTGGAASYVEGPLARTFPVSLATAATYIFPVGKTDYQLFEMVNPTTNAGAASVIRVEAVDGATGGTASAMGGGSLNADNYWSATATSNPASLTSAGVIRVTETGLTNGTHHLCNASTLTGAYTIYGSSYASPKLSTISNMSSGLGYYVVGTPGNLSGVYTVGVGGDATSITNVGGLFDIMNLATLTGNVTIRIISDISGETGTVALNEWKESPLNSNFTLKIEPQTGTSAIRTITGNYNGANAAAAGLFRFDGADRVTIDGREPSTGTGKWLKFQNTNATAASNFSSTVTFINDATNITLQHAYFEGATVGATCGVIFFSTAGGTTLAGNDDNTIANCIIKNAGANNTTLLPTTGILSNGTNTAGRENSNVTISNNEIYDFFVTGQTCTGIRCAGAARGNEAWTISGNSIYQTASRSFGSGDFRGISIEHTGNTNFTITGNYIGGTAANCGGTALTLTNAPIFMGIRLSVANTAPASEVQGNVIRNISVNTSSISTAQGGISITQGAANVGTTTANEIGSSTVANSIAFSISGVSAQFNGISCGTGGVGAYDIRNNNIGGIQISGSTGIAVRGIAITTNVPTALTVMNNTIGSTTQADNITQLTNGSFYGIQYTIATNNAFMFTNNKVANIRINDLGTSAQFIGITTAGGANTITGNEIYSIYSLCQATASTLVGISNTSTSTSGQLVSGNIIHSLKYAGTITVPAKMIGIYMGTPATGNNIAERNYIHSFTAYSNSNTAENTGIEIAANTNANVYNNIIRLGINADGTDSYGPTILTGILDASTAANKVYHNTVAIAGLCSGATAAANTYAFRRNVTTGADDIRNNIFVNVRTGGFGASYHFAMALNTVVAGSTIDYNLYNAVGTNYFSTAGTPVPLAGSTAALQLQNLRAAAGNNLHSGAATISQINFISALNAAPGSLDLHLNNATCASDAGVDLSATVAGDFDLTTGRTTTPDIGADEGAFDSPIAAANDVYSPLFSFTPITNQASCSGGSSATVNITVNDLGVGLSTSSNQPRMYIRKAVGSAPGTSWSNSQLFTGSFVSGTANASVWQFTIDYSSLGITAASADEFEYYFTAADQATTPNIWYSNFNATTPVHSAVNNFTVAQAGTFTLGVNRYSIIVPLSGTVTVGGTGGATYTTLTGAGGLFIDLFNRGLSDDLDVKIRSNTTENGTYFLYAPTQYCGTGHKITITPETGSTKTLSGSLIGLGLIGFSGVDDVTIDGSFGGGGRYLTFANTYAGTGGSVNSTLYFENHATGNTIKNCVINGATQKTGGGVITLYTASGAGIGNSNNTFENNIISGTTNWASKLVYSIGSASTPNSGNVFTNNELNNFMIWSGGTTRAYGVHIAPTGNGSNWTFTGNSIYNTGSQSNCVQTAFLFEPGASSSGNVISGNYIGGSSANCGTGGSVTYWGNGYDDFFSGLNHSKALQVSCGTVAIDSNTIQNIRLTNSDNATFTCMEILGATVPTITRNTFGSTTQSLNVRTSGGSWSFGFSPGIMYGIRSTTSGDLNINNNNFYYMSALGAGYGGSMRTIYHTGAGVSKINYNNLNGPQASGIDEDSWGIYVSPSATTTGNEIIGNSIDGPYLVDPVNGAGFLGWMENHGIYVAGNTGIVIKDNNVYDLRNYSTDGSAYGIRLRGTGIRQVINNQISMENITVPSGNSNNPGSIYGIRDEMTSAGTVEYLFNSIHVGGTNTTGVDWVGESYAYDRYPNMTGSVAGASVRFKNNVFVSSRSGGTASKHAAISNFSNSGLQATNWAADSSDYNFLASLNSASLGLWGNNALYDFANWKTQSNGDKNSWHVPSTTGTTTATQVNGSDLFLNTRLGYLTPDSTKQACWFVNGKGVAGSLSGSVATDARGVARTTTYGYGVNIGAVENHAASGVLPFDITATPSLGGTNTFSFAGKQFGSITWLNSGTVPTSISARYYTGDFPGTAPSPAYGYTDGTDFMVQYVPTGGNNYRYNTTLNYDEALRGTFVTDETTMEMVKTDNPNNTWGTVPFTLDVNNNTLTSSAGIKEFSFFGGGMGVPLPVTLVGFDAACTGTEVVINWQTALELNNDYFTIERAADGVNFTPIAQIQGAGNSTTLLNYTFKDREPLEGINYYRLKQTDYDGQFEYFNTVAAGCAATAAEVNVYPNPANNNITISFSSSGNTAYQLRIYDVTGKLVTDEKQPAVKGLQSRTLDISALAAGVYMLSLESETEKARFKFTKQGN